jgi:chemotaxis protein CheX
MPAGMAAHFAGSATDAALVDVIHGPALIATIHRRQPWIGSVDRHWCMMTTAHATACHRSDLLIPFMRAAEAVFSTMLQSHCLWHTPQEWSPSAQPGDLSASVSLTGGVHGHVGVHLPQSGACRVAERLTGIEIDDVDDLVLDSVGELANMIGGHGKRELEHLHLLLGLPQVQSAPAWHNEPQPLPVRYWVPMSTEFGDCGLDVGFRVPAAED